MDKGAGTKIVMEILDQENLLTLAFQEASGFFGTPSSITTAGS
jgi:hypothetical protein